MRPIAAEGGGDECPTPDQQNQLVVTVKADGIDLNTSKMASPQALRDALAPQMVSRPPRGLHQRRRWGF